MAEGNERSEPAAEPAAGSSSTAVALGRLLRRALDGSIVLIVVGAGLVAALTQLAPLLGHRVFVIQSGSMAPAIPVGAAVVVSADVPDGLAVGDVVTLRTGNQTVVTHRVIRVAELRGVPHIETKGDASATADPVLVPESSVIGRVEISVPLAGYLIAYLTTPLGIISVLLVVGTLLAAVWALEDFESGALGAPSPAEA